MKKKKKSNFSYWWGFWVIFILGLISIGFWQKDKLKFYYSLYFKEYQHKKLTNTPYETERINKIIKRYSDKTFGLDISHYQRRKDILWDSLYINGVIPLEFIVLRATMGERGKDQNFHYFWKKAKERQLIRGAYHFYRPDEEPILQAQSFLKQVNLQSGDLLPVLDIEKLPKRKSQQQYLADVKTWLNIVEKAYGKKPIIYTYYHFYKDYLRGKFDDYPLWLANYNNVSEPSNTDRWKIWQFTEKGIVSGINTKVDINVYNGSKREMKELLLD
ncbi:MAG: GH25 family lysozyme [Flavobacteriaceae bacterium]|nr:GH25 family lysozyme [Flavobacteriaceae bacterium]